MKCYNRTCGEEIELGQAFETEDNNVFCDDVCAAFERAYKLEDEKRAKDASIE